MTKNKGVEVTVVLRPLEDSDITGLWLQKAVMEYKEAYGETVAIARETYVEGKEDYVNAVCIPLKIAYKCQERGIEVNTKFGLEKVSEWYLIKNWFIYWLVRYYHCGTYIKSLEKLNTMVRHFTPLEEDL